MSVQPVEGMSGRKRRPNWTEQECLLLAQLMQERKHIIRGKYCTGISVQDKRQAWEEIVQTINAAFPQAHRTVSDCNKKWENLLAKAKEEIKRLKRQAIKDEALSAEHFSIVTQIVISVMNLSDMLQQDTSVSELMETHQNSCDKDGNDITVDEKSINLQVVTQQEPSFTPDLPEQKMTSTNVTKSLLVDFNGSHAAAFPDSGELVETSCSPSVPSAHCTTLQERMDLEMSVLRRQEAVLKLQQEYYTLKIRLMKKQMEEFSQKDGNH